MSGKITLDEGAAIVRLHAATNSSRAAVLLTALVFGCSAALPDDIFHNGFPNETSFFPLGVRLQSPARAPRYKEMGINVFVGLWGGRPKRNSLHLQNTRCSSSPSKTTLGYAQRIAT